MENKLLNRLLALDIGVKRIGVAVSDPLNMFSIGLETINRKPHKDSISAIRSLCEQYSIKKIIAGLPLNLKGQKAFQAEDVQNYILELGQALEIEIITQDERLTSVMAQKILIEQNISPSKNKGLIDKKAAELILQQYLDSTNKD
jgi:putative Holliday junction resolvase